MSLTTLQMLYNQNEDLTGTIGAAFIMLINALISRKASIGSKAGYPNNYGPELVKASEKSKPLTFDMIIVGGGVAGCVLANRLSEVKKWNVLLLEAGNYPTQSTEVPAFFLEMHATNEDWNFITEPERNACQGLRDKKCKLSRGKVLGGTSTINNMHYVRALPTDFYNWPSADTKWHENLINKHYNKIERCQGGKPNCERTFKYNTIGDLFLGSLGEDNEIKKVVYEAGKNMSLEKMTMYSYLGYTELLGTLNNGVRENFAKAFLNPVRHRPNLFVATDAFVSRILTQLPTDRKVDGVTVQIGKKEAVVKVKNEVILTAGAINTAKLLLVSGFGPKTFLKKMNIKPIVDCNVGRNFQDQLGVLIFVGIDRDQTPRDQKEEIINSAYSFLMHREGALTRLHIHDLVGFINTKNDSTSLPNIMVYHYFFDRSDYELEIYLNNLGFDDRIVESILAYNKNESIILFMPTIVKPKSKGEILLRTNNPFDELIIKGNYLSDSDNEDFQDLLSGVTYIMSLIETESLVKRQAHFLKIDMKNCRNLKYCNKPYLECVVKNMAVPLSQVIGTAKMGEDGSTSVTNDDLLVNGIRNLRIADASIIPGHVTGNLEATVAMIANKISDKIKEDWVHK